MRTRLALATVLASLALAPAVFAHDGPHDGANAHAAGSSEAAPAEDPDAAARAELAAAKQRLGRAEAAFSLMMARNFPRGEPRVAIEKERDAARAEWQRLSAARPDLVKQLTAGQQGDGG
jgi:hypothetical protein